LYSSTAGDEISPAEPIAGRRSRCKVRPGKCREMGDRSGKIGYSGFPRAVIWLRRSALTSIRAKTTRAIRSIVLAHVRI
jgi:hypothetical protein